MTDEKASAYAVLQEYAFKKLDEYKSFCAEHGGKEWIDRIDYMSNRNGLSYALVNIAFYYIRSCGGPIDLDKGKEILDWLESFGSDNGMVTRDTCCMMRSLYSFLGDFEGFQRNTVAGIEYGSLDPRFEKRLESEDLESLSDAKLIEHLRSAIFAYSRSLTDRVHSLLLDRMENENDVHTRIAKTKRLCDLRDKMNESNLDRLYQSVVSILEGYPIDENLGYDTFSFLEVMVYHDGRIRTWEWIRDNAYRGEMNLLSELLIVDYYDSIVDWKDEMERCLSLVEDKRKVIQATDCYWTFPSEAIEYLDGLCDRYGLDKSKTAESKVWRCFEGKNYRGCAVNYLSLKRPMHETSGIMARIFLDGLSVEKDPEMSEHLMSKDYVPTVEDRKRIADAFGVSLNEKDTSVSG